MPLNFGFLNCKLGITTQRLSHRVTVRLKKNITKLQVFHKVHATARLGPGIPRPPAPQVCLL